METTGTADVVIPPQIYPYGAQGEQDTVYRSIDLGRFSYIPVWQFGPRARDASLVNLDLLSHSSLNKMITEALEVKHALLSEVTDVDFILDHTTVNSDDSPRSYVLTPVFGSLEDNPETIVGFVVSIVPWERFFTGILPSGINGLVVEVHESCGSGFAFLMNGHDVDYNGEFHRHDSNYEHLAVVADFVEFATYDGTSETERCKYTMSVYPTDEFHSDYDSSDPIIFTVFVVLVFIFTALVFLLYDWFVSRRQKKLSLAAERTAKIVTSIFPKGVGRKMIEDAEEKERQRANEKRAFFKKGDVRSLLDQKYDRDIVARSQMTDKPLADLFPVSHPRAGGA